MSKSNIEERVKKIVCEQLGVGEEEVTSSASFIDDLGADSLDTVELVMAIEEEFSIEIPDEAAEKISNLQEATRGATQRLLGGRRHEADHGRAGGHGVRQRRPAPKN